MTGAPANSSVSERTRAAELDAMLDRVQSSGAVPSNSPAKVTDPVPKKVTIHKIRATSGEVPVEPRVIEATIPAKEPQPSKKHGASVHSEGEGSCHPKKRRAPKKKTALRDLNYGRPFGGVADYFGWAPITTPMEFLHSSQGKTRHRPMRTYKMEDVEGRSTSIQLPRRLP
ncbi:hypothetical protein ACLOJK_008978 [Asimina triloba]